MTRRETSMLSISRPNKHTILYSAVVILFVLLASMGWGTSRAFAATDVGYRDHSFAANLVANPTGEKPQSKLWFNDGIWWASMFNKTTEEFRIYRHDRSGQTWSDTGTLIDERNSSKADTLWDGTHLYVASAGPQATNANHGVRIMRYSYDPATKKYALDQGFPVTLTPGGVETIVLDKDSAGKLWVTYTRNSTFTDDASLPRQVYVSHTLNDDRTWATPFVLPVKGASNLSSDDISAVVSFDSQIGVMWSNQVDDAMYFATHKDGDPDTVWQSSRTAIQGPKYADDHISLRSVQATDSSGRVFAAVKTSLGDVTNPSPSAPLIMLLVRDKDGNWTNHTFSRVGDNQTRPILMLDEEHRDLYMFATSSCCNGGAIVYKKTNINNISFADGPGDPFIKSGTDVNINDATSTKQNVSSATGLMVMASSTVSGYYWHNAVALAALDTTPPVAPAINGPADGSYDADGNITLSGTAEANTTVELFDDAISKGTTQADALGNWSKTLGGVAEGSHVYTAKATDAAGNTSVASSPRTVTVDTTTPSVNSTTPAEGATGVATTDGVTVTFSEPMDASTITASNFTLTKQGSPTPVGAGVSYDGAARRATLTPDSGLEAGATYTAVVRGGSGGVKDLAGNALLQDKVWSFTTAQAADTTPPVAPAINGPADGSYDADGNITLSGTAEANTTVELFDDAISKGTTQADALGNWSKTLSGVSEGPHAYTAKATDAAGNTSLASGASTVIVDTTAPNTAITSGPSGPTNSASATFAFSSSEANSTFECGLDGAAFTSCTSPKGYTGLSDGSHTFSVRATDAAGNAGPASGRTWSVDATAPTVSGVTPAGSATNVAVGTSIEATFSEAMNSSTVGQGTFTLVRQGTTTPVTATVSYDAQAGKAVLKPAATLVEGTTYTATIKGGTNGVKDTAGNPLQADKTWSFSTTAVMAPGNLSAARAGSGNKQRVDLSWLDNSKVEAKVVIERSTVSNFTSNLVTYEAPANATSYADTVVQPNKQYFYRVFAVNSAGTKSVASNVASVTTGK